MITLLLWIQYLFILGYDASDVEKAKKFLIKCRTLLESDSNLFWVAFQSNVLADVDNVKDDFKRAFEEAKHKLEGEEKTVL